MALSRRSAGTSHIGEHELILLLRPFALQAVVLHGCDTGRADSRDALAGVAGALLRAGIPAVLAQQAKFTYASSRTFSRNLYPQLASGESLAEATFQGRQELALGGQPDWAVPTLRVTAAALAPFRDPTTPPGPADPTLAGPAIPLDLPAPTGVFVGRQRELRSLRRMLEDPPGNGATLALIQGPGGVGKSTLAAQAILRYGGQYRAGLTLRCVGYTDFDLFLQQLATFLAQYGVPHLAEQWKDADTAARIQLAIAALNRAGPFVLLFDNLESAQAEDLTIRDPDLLAFLHALLTNLRGGRVLLIGRFSVPGLLPEGRFHTSLVSIDLGDLSDGETRQLIARHDRLGRLDPAIRDELLREFHGLPYLYDLLSSEAAGRDLDRLIRDIHDRLTPERSGPAWDEVRTNAVRFATLDATVDRLPKGARQLLAAVRVLRRPWPSEAMTAGLAATETDFHSLLDWSLLRLEADGTYTLHSLTRDYAADRFADYERQSALLRLATWYESYAHRSPDLTDDLEAHWLLGEAEEYERAGQLANNLLPFLERFGLHRRWRELCQATIATTIGSIAAEAQRQLGILAQRQSDYTEARRRYDLALGAFERLGDQRGAANSLHQLGIIAQRQGDYPEARRLYGEVQATLQRLGDHGGVATTLHQLGTLAHQQDDYPEARRLYGESLTIKEHLGDQGGIATTLGQLGLLERKLGDHRAALGNLVQAYTIFETLRSPNRNSALTIIAELRAELGADAFTALWAEVGGDHPLPVLPSSPAPAELAQRLIAFINAGTWGESQRLVEAQPDLLGDEADQTLQALASAQTKAGLRETIEAHRALLARCRTIGVATAFAEFLAE